MAEEIAKVTGTYQGFGHPIEINWELAPLYLKAAADVSRRLRLADPIPKLCTLVTAARSMPPSTMPTGRPRASIASTRMALSS